MVKLITDDEDARSSVTRHLVLGDAALQYTVAADPGTPLLVLELAPEPGDGARAMEFLRPADTTARSVSAVTASGGSSRSWPAEPLATWSGTGVTPEFEAHFRATRQQGGEQSNLSSLAPVMLLRTHTAAPDPYTEVLMCARVRSIGVLFVRVGRFDHPAESDATALVPEALALSTSLQDNVRIEGNAYVTYEPGIEIEQKIDLDDDVSIWALTKDLWAAVENGEFPGFITDPGYELTRWHFVQHNFEVLAPAGEIGYIAFQENPGGRYQLKQKKFPADALRREETFRKGVVVPDGRFEDYLAREYPALEFRRLPGFMRSRFDVNVQSVVTGHYFGIEVDEVTVLAPRSPRLRQVEMEYLETRWHAGMDPASIDTDLERLTCLVEAQLAKHGISGRRSLYSKLSFLRDCPDVPAAGE